MAEPDPASTPDADDALYQSFYGEHTRPLSSSEDEELYAAIYGQAGRAPLSDEDQQLYDAVISEN